MCLLRFLHLGARRTTARNPIQQLYSNELMDYDFPLWARACPFGAARCATCTKRHVAPSALLVTYLYIIQGVEPMDILPPNPRRAEGTGGLPRSLLFRSSFHCQHNSTHGYRPCLFGELSVWIECRGNDWFVHSLKHGLHPSNVLGLCGLVAC